MDDLLATDARSGKATNFGLALKNTTQLLRGRQIPYVLIGKLATNMIIRPRFTNEIEIVCDFPAVDQLAEELRLNANQHECMVDITLCRPASPPMEHALQHQISRVEFDTPANFASALSLCWIFLERESFQSTVNAGEILVTGAVDITELRTLLVQRDCTAALSRLERVLADIQRERYLGADGGGNGYCASVRARLERLKLKNIEPITRDDNGRIH